MEVKEAKKNLQQLPRNPSRKPRKGKGKTPTPVLLSLAKNPLKLAIQTRNTVLYTVNVVILRTVARIYALWSISTSKKRRRISGTTERVTKN